MVYSMVEVDSLSPQGEHIPYYRIISGHVENVPLITNTDREESGSVVHYGMGPVVRRVRATEEQSISFLMAGVHH